MAPPRLSAQSAERMKQVVGRADDLVDSGTAPNTAIAKAASEFRMPAGHVDHVVHAFNTGRAIRQLGEADPWTKAAAHPVASTEGVMAELTGRGPAKKAADLSDYFKAPTNSTEIRPCFIPLVEKKASAPVVESEPAPAPVVKRAVDGRMHAVRAAVEAYDKALEIAAGLSPEKYAAAKQAATALHPDTAKFLFENFEAVHPGILLTSLKQASFDPTVTVRHPLVLAVGELEAAKKAHVDPKAESIPEGYELLPGANGVSVFRKLAVCPVLGTPIQPTPKPVPEPPKARDPLDFDTPKFAAAPKPGNPDDERKTIGFAPDFGIGSRLGTAVSRIGKVRDMSVKVNPDGTVPEVYKDPPGGPSAFTKGFRGPMQLLNKNIPGVGMPLLGPWSQKLELTQPSNNEARTSAVGDLPAQLDRADQHAAIQNMLSDPRFMAADPKTIVDTYRDLTNLAPTAMRNRSLASDFIQRRLQTGPLQYFDMKTLTEIEKNLAAARKDRMQEEDD